MEQKLPNVSHAEDADQWSEPLSQMKIIDQKNETIGNFTISQEELSAILANKSDGGVVTVHIQSSDGTLNPIQLQIIPEDQIVSAQYHPDDEPIPQVSEESKLAKDAISIVKVEGHKSASVVQLPKADFRDLLAAKKGPKLKSLVFKQVEKGLRGSSNILSTNPNLRNFIKLRPYVDPTIESVLTESTLPTSKSSSRFQCQCCGKYFSFANNLRRHITNIHQKGNQIKAFSCSLCPKSFSRKDYLKTHVKTVHHHDNTNKCNQCNKTFSQRGSLLKHIESIHLNKKRYQCKYCSYVSHTTNDIKKHAAVIHLKRSRYECVFCGFTNWSAYEVKLHLRKAHNIEDGKTGIRERGSTSDPSGNNKSTKLKTPTKSSSSRKKKKSSTRALKVDDAADLVPWLELAVKQEDEEEVIEVTEKPFKLEPGPS